MPCDRALKKNQTIQQRAEEIRTVVANTSAALASGRIKAIISAEGGIAFLGLTDKERDGVTDNCLVRRILAGTSTAAKLAIARAEQKAGRRLNMQAIGQGLHSHDGGATWHRHKG